MKNYEFTTARGAKIEITAGDHFYSHEIKLDGQETGVFDKSTDFICEQILVNGTKLTNVRIEREFEIKGTVYNDVATGNLNNNFVMIPIPTEIFNDFYAGQLARNVRMEENLRKSTIRCKKMDEEQKTLERMMNQ